MSWFGRKKSAQAPSSVKSKQPAGRPADPGATIVQLRESINTQEKREEHIQRKMDAMVEEAKTKMAKNDKKGALFALKRKKLFETELDKIQNVKMTLETQVMNLESATQNAQTLQAMKAGRDGMAKVRTDVGIEKVDEMMDDIREEMEMANEISNAIGQPIDALMTDDDELLAELEMLSADKMEQEMLKTPARKDDLKLPTVPNAKLPALALEEENELKKLEAELAGMMA